ncbi:MAG TPA: ATP-binding cassette domain-containing protein [Planktothrix sp.]
MSTLLGSAEGAAISIIKTEQLTRKFKEFTAVDAVSLTTELGECFGLLGPNGAGKSTFIKMLTTLLPPTSGTAVLAGQDVVKNGPNVRRLIGYVPQMLSADGGLTGYENLLISAKLYDIPRAEREERIHEVLTRVGLEESANKIVRAYSGGMIRRLEVAQATLHKPRVLFLDEPTVGLDPQARRSVWEMIEQLRELESVTVFMTTHFMEEADLLCDRVAIMNRGKIAVVGTPEELKASVDKENATLEDAFLKHTGANLEEGGRFVDTARTRRTANRLG